MGAIPQLVLPLSPPRSLNVQRDPTGLPWKFRKMGAISLWLLQTGLEKVSYPKLFERIVAFFL